MEDRSRDTAALESGVRRGLLREIRRRGLITQAQFTRLMERHGR